MTLVVDTLHAAAKRACWDIHRYRQSGCLKDVELSLSFLAFTFWYLESLTALGEGDDSKVRYPSDPARFAAIDVLTFAAAQPKVSAELQRKFGFNPATELQWAVEKANNPIWQECLTRAVIMGCRSMAYSVATATGYNAMPVDVTEDGLALGKAVENLPPNAVIGAASLWLDRTFGRSLSRQLFSLDEIQSNSSTGNQCNENVHQKASPGEDFIDGERLPTRAITGTIGAIADILSKIFKR